MASNAAGVYEAQNDASLDQLYSKVRSLRTVTIDIHNDSESQRTGLLAQTADSFDSFGSRLKSTSQNLGRTIRQGARQYRTTLYIVGGMVALFLVWKLI